MFGVTCFTRKWKSRKFVRIFIPSVFKSESYAGCPLGGVLFGYDVFHSHLGSRRHRGDNPVTSTSKGTVITDDPIRYTVITLFLHFYRGSWWRIPFNTSPSFLISKFFRHLYTCKFTRYRHVFLSLSPLFISSYIYFSFISLKKHDKPSSHFHDLLFTRDPPFPSPSFHDPPSFIVSVSKFNLNFKFRRQYTYINT